MSIIIDLYRNAGLGNRLDGAHPLGDGSVSGTGAALSLVLSGAGRVGFYVDYSELSAAGTHTFYVARTHGTTGAVTVDYATSGDAHTTASGTLSWADGEADIKSFTVAVPSKTAGDHRIVATLSNPAGGLVLHHGVDTVAHGVIDDDTIATSNAIFIDADAVSDGDGSQGNPFNNWYSARAATVLSTRYIYIKGNMVPDGTDNNAGGLTVKHFLVPVAWSGLRSSESQRLYIRSWPGFSGGIDGGGQTDCAGFYAENDIRYITFRRLSVTNLDNRDGGSSTGKSYFIRNRGSCSYWTVERVSVAGINSGANAATAVWFSESGSGAGEGGFNHKMWRVDADNCTHHFTGEDLNLLETYRADNFSVQRCTIGATCGGIYQKSTLHEGTSTGFTVRHNLLNSSYVRLSHQGTTSNLADYHIVQGNIFDSVDSATAPLRIDSAGTPPDTSTKQWIVGNIFYNYSNSTHAPIRVEEPDYTNAIIFNNIFHTTRGTYRFDSGPNPEYSDYNHFYLLTGEEFVLNNSGGVYNSLIDIQGQGFETNSLESDPSFVDAVAGNFTLNGGSPALASGVSSTDKGPYLVGDEVIGA